MGRGWVPAANIDPGEAILGHDGHATPVDEVRFTEQYAPVYNLRVAEDHTYFVGGEGWGFSLWAHNEYKVEPRNGVLGYLDPDGNWHKFTDEQASRLGEGVTAENLTETQARDLVADWNSSVPRGELLHGSGPKPGFLEVSGRVKSTRAVQNCRDKNPVDFRFDAEAGRFVMGKGGVLGHDAIPGVSSKSPGGTIRFENGKLITDEYSGHYGQLWTPEIRAKFVEFMKSHGVDITHMPWGA